MDILGAIITICVMFLAICFHSVGYTEIGNFLLAFVLIWNGRRLFDLIPLMFNNRNPKNSANAPEPKEDK